MSENEDPPTNQGPTLPGQSGPPEPERSEGPQNTTNVSRIDDQVRRHIFEFYSLI